jgi:hypothetical protein
MSRLIKYKLEFSSAFEFVQETLDQANTMSSELLNLLNFVKGSFFTFLPVGINQARLYEFSSGGIDQRFYKTNNDPEKSNGNSLIHDIRNKFCDLILKKIQKQIDLVCVFDDVLRSPTDSYGMDLFHSNGLLYMNEIYYLLEQHSISKNLIQDCLRASNACWHSLCILTSATIDKSAANKLTLDTLYDICLNAEIVVVGAYDGEGYIFWEKV